MYKENPKTAGSGIVCAIPQKGECPQKCPDCFFQSGRSYLEPLVENLPNIPPLELCRGRVVRINDGNDSNVDRKTVLAYIKLLQDNGIDCFANTSIPNLDFPCPIVLTINPGEITNIKFHELDPPRSLMYVRFRANTWNTSLMDDAVAYYTSRNVPVVLTFMAYWKYEGSIPKAQVTKYVMRKRTLNTYLAITTLAWRRVMRRYEDNPLVHSCGKIEGEKGKSGCKFCGNCLREYYATLERMRT